ncbi:putative nuclease HARBI1 isoform X2 [Trematomus bernacchii]|uniref:putative nuclease HARBI1 isoform X2 n=1 Tax=Trematomus bernacchii TaxID=40690 RepID=UPI00146BD8D7|nr:putative nuclease HARBI1 isoform X2 [Trematomus bernacchii]
MGIVDLVARWPGSTHDARILRESALQREFEAGRINGLLLGDSGYPLKRWLMTPVIAERTAQERRYNEKHTQTRNIVERCIGVLKRFTASTVKCECTLSASA